MSAVGLILLTIIIVFEVYCLHKKIVSNLYTVFIVVLGIAFLIDGANPVIGYLLLGYAVIWKYTEQRSGSDRENLPYREGSVFAVPLHRGGYAVGVVARVPEENAKGVLLCYFFGPRRGQLPSGDVAETLEPGEAIKVVKCGDIGLMNGWWRVIGQIDGWKREDWPVPDFARKHKRTGEVTRVRYADDNLRKPVSEKRVKDAGGLESDRSIEAGALEAMLSNLL